MRAYDVKAVDDDDNLIGRRFGGSNADARAKRDDLIEKFDIKKSQVSIEETEIPTDKAGLLEFLNAVMEEVDATDPEE